MRKPRLLATAILAAALALSGAASATASTHASTYASTHGTSTASHATARAVRPLISTPNNAAVPTAVHRTGATNPPLVSGSWSGYGVDGVVGAFTSVSSNWVQPRIDYSVPGTVSTWVGLDGLFGQTDNAVEQIGTAAQSVNGLPDYYAWYEMYPLAPVVFSNPLEPGDNMTGSVTYANGSYTLYLRDLTEGWSQTAVVAGSGEQNSSAEVILEAQASPPPNSHTLPLTQFGYTRFFGSTVNGHAISAADPNTFALTMNDANGGGVAQPSGTDAQGGFSVTDGAANSLAGDPLIAHNSPSSVGSYVHLSTPSATLGATATTSYMGQAAYSDPVVTTLPGGGFEMAYDGSTPPGPRLMVAGTSFTFNTQLGMALNTKPAIAAAPDGTWEAVFQANTGQLYKYTPQTGGVPLGYAMAGNTSPSITALPGGGYGIAFQGTDGALWEISGTSAAFDTHVAMAGGTSPAVAAPTSGGLEVAFQDSAGYYCDMGLLIGVCPNTYPMKGGTSPAITALAGGGFESAFEANTALLWEVGTYIKFNTQLGMMAGTSPGITTSPTTVFTVAFQANTGQLWLQDLAHGGRSQWISATGSPSISQ